MPQTASLARLLDELGPNPEPEDLYARFEAWAAGRGMPLYPHQADALFATLAGANTIITTPTGSGKSLIATAAHVATLAARGRVYYTAPIKALVSEKFFAWVDDFGADLVGKVTGDASVNPDAPIICCTAEILANIALRRVPARMSRWWSPTSTTSSPTPTVAGPGRWRPANRRRPSS